MTYPEPQEQREQIKIYPMPSKVVECYSGVNGRKWRREVVGWVAGIIYDGSEWLYGREDWCSLWDTRRAAVIFKTMEKAIAHARKFKENPKFPKFVRPYMKETLLPKNNP